MVHRKPLIILISSLLVFLSAACGQKSQVSLVGSWTTDLGKDLGLMTIKFGEDGKVETVFNQNPNAVTPGTYKVVDGNVLEITTQAESGQEQTVQMEFDVKDTKLTFTRNGETQVFYRVKDN